jgi:hypothetical protein
MGRRHRAVPRLIVGQRSLDCELFAIFIDDDQKELVHGSQSCFRLTHDAFEAKLADESILPVSAEDESSPHGNRSAPLDSVADTAMIGEVCCANPSLRMFWISNDL